MLPDLCLGARRSAFGFLFPHFPLFVFLSYGIFFFVEGFFMHLQFKGA